MYLRVGQKQSRDDLLSYYKRKTELLMEKESIF